MIGTPSTLPAAVRETGMRRVNWVRIVVTDDGPECWAVGVGHRLPNVCRVTLETALALAESGVPVIVRSGPDASGWPLAG